MVSPVIRLSSISEVPFTTVPSDGTRSPGRTSTRSSGRSAATGTLTSSSPMKRRAVSAFSAARLPATARVLRRMAWSSVRPSSRKNSSIIAESK